MHDPHLRETARDMRRHGASLRQIAGSVGVALSTASLWTRGAEPDVAPTEPVAAPEVGPAPQQPGVLHYCAGCDTELPVVMFSRMGGRLQHWCKPCFRAYHAQRRGLNQARAALLRERRARYVLIHLVAHPCADCDESDPVVLEFDHVRGTKRTEISRLIRDGSSIQTLAGEIEKCDVVCVNCHRLRTKRRTRRVTAPLAHELRGREVIVDRLRAGCCDCGEANVDVLDFDHRDLKRAIISEMPRNGYSVRAIVAEIDRCEIRCANCHRRRTSEERGFMRARTANGATPPPRT